MQDRILSLRGPTRLLPASSVRAWIVALAFVGLASLGCASVKPTQTGYLSDYSQLEKSGAILNWGLGYHRYSSRKATPAAMAGVNSFYVEPVAWLAPEDDWLGHDEDRRETVAKALDAKLRQQLGEIRPIVATPGPNTATVHAAVTGVNSARTILNILASLIWGPISNGGASIEAEVLHPDGRQVAAIAGASHGGMLDYIGYYLRSSHARTSVRRLAKNLASASERGGPPTDAVKK